MIIALAPGDPAFMMLGPEATPQQLALERARLGLDKPIPVRYLIWLSDVAKLNLGTSQSTRRPVTMMVAEAFPYTLRLSLSALLISLLLGFPTGILSAVRQDSRTDAAITGFNSLALAVPPFWLGILMIILFAVQLKWLPASGASSPGESPLAGLRYLIMPVISIAVSNVAVFSRFLRSAMIDVLSADYVRTARAKGLKERAVINHHALKNAMIPVITIIGIQFGRLLGGAVITESVFAYPGIGRLVVNSILNRDYPVVQATMMLVVIIFLVTNIVVDLTYGYLDPRVKYES
ncbi:MAG: ABC transporter permease [Chloroflexi bacterium]|nr:ABC transporter permease [Chloroflexota bacterium]